MHVTPCAWNDSPHAACCRVCATGMASPPLRKWTAAHELILALGLTAYRSIHLTVCYTHTLNTSLSAVIRPLNNVWQESWQDGRKGSTFKIMKRPTVAHPHLLNLLLSIYSHSTVQVDVNSWNWTATHSPFTNRSMFTRGLFWAGRSPLYDKISRQEAAARATACTRSQQSKSNAQSRTVQKN